MESTQLKVRIVRKAVEATDIVSLELAAPDGGRLPGFSAGRKSASPLAPSATS